MIHYCSKCGKNVEDKPKCINCGSEYEGTPIFCATCGRGINNIAPIASDAIHEKYNASNFTLISELLLQEVAARFNQEDLNTEIEFGDNFAELLEKLLIISIRMWKLEDLASQEKNNERLGELKKKIDFCFKVKRPKLIKAINTFLDSYISSKGYRPFTEENIKSYG